MNSKKLLEDLLTINAPSKREYVVAEVVKSIAQKYNIEFHELKQFTPEGGNCPPILFKIDGDLNDDVILLSAHLDTVNIDHDKEIEIIKEGSIYRSNRENILGGDDRLGVAAALIMAIKAKENPSLHSGVEILFTVQEELGCLCTKIFDFSLLKAKINYNLDGEGPVGSIINRAPTKAKYSLKIIGKPSHAALEPEKGNNAIVALSKIIVKLPQGQLDEDTTANIGMISGGKQTNVVAKEAEIIAELRSLNYDKYLIWKDKIEQIVDTESKKLNVKYNLEFSIVYNGYHVNKDTKAVQLFKKACKENKIEPQLLTSQGGGDSNNINNNKIDSVVFGLSMHNIHTVNEYFDIRDFEKALTLLDTILFN